MDSEKKRRLEKEKERLEALQNTEKKFLKNMYGDFFGKDPGGDSGKAGTDDPVLTFGETEASEGTGSAQAGGSADAGAGRQVGEGDSRRKSLTDRMDELERKGREVTDALAGRADALIDRQRAVSADLQGRTDALRRANDALREVQSLLDNPLYAGMPDLTGNGGTGKGNTGGPGRAGSEIAPGLMAGSDGDLFSGFAGSAGGSGEGMPGSGISGAGGSAAGTGTAANGTDANGVAAGGTVSDTAAAQASQQVQAEAEKEPETDPMEDLDKLIGLQKIKHDVRELTDFVKIQKLRKDGGLKSVPVSLHLVFTGNPGTGKTTVARILARLYRQIGVLSKGQLIEVDRSGLVAGYVGQTALKTAKKIEEARGGVLFIDEAYALARKDDTFGQEAIDTILKAMEDNREDFVVIVAGYTKPMEDFINSNPGLKSRFNKYIEFPDYTIDELMGIFDMNCKKYDYEAEDSVRDQIRAMIVQRKLATQENFANAREVRNLFEEIITNQARRVAAIESPTKEDMKAILLEDLVETAEADTDKTLKKAAGAEKKAADKTGDTAQAAADGEKASGGSSGITEDQADAEKEDAAPERSGDAADAEKEFREE